VEITTGRGKGHCDIEVAFAVDHMTLQATELGLATCWICNFDQPKAAEILKLPEHLEPIVLLPVGYPLDSGDPDRHDEKRKSLDEIVRYESPD
jgi:nitroreductase